MDLDEVLIKETNKVELEVLKRDYLKSKEKEEYENSD